jgi:hypothetical protein
MNYLLRLVGCCILAALTSAPAFAQNVTVWYQSSAVQPIVADTDPHVAQTPANSFWTYSDRSSELVVSGGGMSVGFYTPGVSPFTARAYENVVENGNQGDGPGIEFGTTLGSCLRIDARYVVLEVAFDSTHVSTFAADFEVRCDGGPPIYGEVRLNSSLPLTVQKPAQSTVPDAMAFGYMGPQRPSTPVISTASTVYGVNAPVPISIQGGQYSVNGGDFTSQPGVVVNRDSVRVRVTSPASPGTQVAVLDVGGMQVQWLLPTYAPGQPLSAFELIGNPSSAVGRDGGIAYAQLGSATYRASMWSVPNGVQVNVSLPRKWYGIVLQAPVGQTLAPGVYEMTRESNTTNGFVQMSVGESGPNGQYATCAFATGRFVILEIVTNSGELQRLAADFDFSCAGAPPVHGEVRYDSIIPPTALKPDGSTLADPFVLLAPSPAIAGEMVVSNTISVLGVNAPVPVSVGAGEYSINGGAFTSAAGYANPYDRVAVRMRAAQAAGGVATSTLSLGGTTAQLTATTYQPGALTNGMIYRDGDGLHDYRVPKIRFEVTGTAMSAGTGPGLLIWTSDGQVAEMELVTSTNGSVVPGTYETTWSVSPTSLPLFKFMSPGLTECSNSVGRVNVRAITFDRNNFLSSLALDFQTSCDSRPLVYGQVRFNSTVPFDEMASHPWRTDIGAAPKMDFNGDGKADLLVHDFDGSYFISFMDGINLLSRATVIPANTGKTVVRTGDFNGDGKTDLIVQNYDTSTEVWLLDGATVMATAPLMPAGRGWSVTHVGDFNGDGKSDLLWTNENDGSVGMWLMDGTAQLQRATMLVANSGYAPIGVGDFNHDGKSDVMWRNTADGTTSIWLMNGLAIMEKGPVMAATSAWRAVKLGDFDGDGMTDVLWQNQQDGSTSMWLMNGRAIKEKGQVMPAGAWSPLMVGDFNADGRADILWGNTDRSVGLWLMNGRTLVQRKSMAIAGAPIVPLMTADLDGNSTSDVLFITDAGSIGAWILAGTDVVASGAITGGQLFTGRDYRH